MYNYNVPRGIKLTRKHMRLSQAELALRMGVTRETINRYETGKTRPTLEFITNLSEISDISVEFILQRKKFAIILRRKLRLISNGVLSFLFIYYIILQVCFS